MKEFMLYVRNVRDAKKAMTPEEHLAFIRQCESYIGVLKSHDKLIAAQPIMSDGVVIGKTGTGWSMREIAGEAEVQVGYYHIRANDIDDAVAIAKGNPEFEFVPSASVEIRLIKTQESETGFVYPTAR